MAVASITVNACDHEVDAHGVIVCQLRNAPTEEVERFVQAVRAVSHQKVDWQLVNKYPTILTTGDVDIVMQVVLDNIAEYKGIAIYRPTDPK